MTVLRPVLAGLVLVCTFVAGCSRESSGVAEVADAVAAYGYGPKPDPKVTYQPDVILMSEGPNIIRGVGQGGLTWTIDGDAEEADQLVPGKIMFASARAVGRIVHVEPRGDDLAVTVVPVALTEIVRDANIQVNTRLNPRSPLAGNLVLRDAKVYVSSEPLPDDEVRFVRAAINPGGKTMTDQKTYAGSIEAGSFEVQPFIKVSSKSSEVKEEAVGEIGVRVSRVTSGGPKIAASVSLTGKAISIRANLIIVDGEMQDSSSFVIDGVEGLDVGLITGSEEARVWKLRLEDAVVDTGTNLPPLAGIPLAITFKMKVYVEFAFSSGDSTLNAKGSYTLTGPIGYENGSIQKPTIKLVNSMLQSVEGHTVGPAGVVFATEFRVLLGVGSAEAAVAGGYGKLIVSTGVSQGSALGLPLAQCHGVTLKLDGGTGAGVELNKQIMGVLDQLNPDARKSIKTLGEKFGKGKLELDIGKEFNIVNVSAVEPNIPLCGGGAA